MHYDESIIEQVRNANDIVDIVGRHVRLTKKGANYFGLCPFHGEKTASFSVSPRKQIYYCFGCGAGGSVIDFMMQYENYSFQEAVRALAENAHIELPENSFTGKEDKQASQLKAKLLEINKEAAIYFNRVLRSPEGRIGYEYFSDKRKLKDETITHFGLGYSEKTSDAMYRYLKSKGYDDESLNKSGLVIFSEKGVRDRFWNRVMFPIMDTNNRVIGFGGRVMGDGEPKYLNSPETPIFDKSSNLYGLNFARRSRARFFLLCEGYMDVIALHQAGFTNAVASLGTAFTEKHARLLKRYTDNVILTQDSDKAGVNAKLKAFPILYRAGLNVKVLDTGKYKDPDELIKAEGAEGYERCIKNAKNAFIFMISVLKDSFDLSDPAEKTAFIRETAGRLCMFRDSIERGNYVDSVSREFMIDRDELSRLTERMAENGNGFGYGSDGYDAAGRGRRQEREQVGTLVSGGSSLRRAAGGSSAGNHAGRDHTGTAGRADGSNSAGGHGLGSDREQFDRDLNTASAASGSNAARPGTTGNERNAAADTATASYEALIISWLSERPELRNVVFAYIKPEDFSIAVCRKIAEAINSTGDAFEPAVFLNNDELDEDERRLAAGIFSDPDRSGSVLGMSQADIEKGLTEALRSIRLAHIDREIAACGNDIAGFGRLLKEKEKLKSFAVRL